MGPNAGKYATDFACKIVLGGFVCGAKRTTPHKRGYSCSTSNLIGHLCDGSRTCDVHTAALKLVEGESKNYVEVDGASIKIFNFGEAFTCASAAQAPGALPPPFPPLHPFCHSPSFTNVLSRLAPLTGTTSTWHRSAMASRQRPVSALTG